MSHTFQSELKQECTTCTQKQPGFLCQMCPDAAKEFASIRQSMVYPPGATLFFENQDPRGIFLLCSGQVKLSLCSSNGKTLVLRIAKAGDILGINSTVSGVPYEMTAETLHPCQVAFIRRSDFMKFMEKHPETYQAVIRQMSSQYKGACQQLRTIGLSTSANEKLARLLLDWSSDGLETSDGVQIRVPWTHEQIAECVGSTRETVSRTLSDFKIKRLITVRGATMTIPSRRALQMVGSC